MDKANKKVLLISIEPYEHRNIACLTLFSVLKNQGVDVELLFLMSEEECNKQLFSKYLMDKQFAVIGISVTTDGYYFASRLTSYITEIVPDAHVIWGGVHPTILPEECLNNVNNICVGDGDVAFVEFVRRIFNNQTYSDIPGIWIKNKDDQIIKNPISGTITDFDTLPIKRYDWSRFYIIDRNGFRSFNINDYVKYSQYGDGYTVLASRFCPYNCSFCSTTFFRKFYPKQRNIMRRSVENVINEIKIAIKDISVIKFINFPDDHFLSSNEWTDKFCDIYKKEIALPFAIRSTPEQLNEDNISLLKSAGLASVQIGVQTGSSRIQKEIYHRHFNRDRIIKVSKLLVAQKIIPRFDIIINSEFENDSDRDKTIELLAELERPFRTNVFSLIGFPGTDILKIYKEKGITPMRSPYKSGVIEVRADIDDWYKQMAFIAGYVSKEQFTYLYMNRDKNEAKNECYKIYLKNLDSIARKEKWVVSVGNKGC